MTAPRITAHVVAFFTIVVWGLTFISTKILLVEFTPLEILFIRFFLGWLALWLLSPHWLPFDNQRRELLFAAAGFSGITLYFLFENVALTCTLASNAAIIVSTTPFFTGLLAWRFLKGEKPGAGFFAGFALAITGIGMISFNGARLSLNPLGDCLALLAAVAWAFYSIFTRKLASLGLGALTTTRRIFFYGLVFMLPFMGLGGFASPLERLAMPVNLFNMLFLGIGASAICFASWTFALKRLGAINASIYIYLVPVVAMITAAIVLHEPLTIWSISGAVLTITGLVTSEFSGRRAKKSEE